MESAVADIHGFQPFHWKQQPWSTPVNIAVARLTRIGKLPVGFAGGEHCWVERPDNGTLL